MNNVEITYDHEGIIKFKKTRPNSALTYIKKLLKEGFRGNEYYYRDSDDRLILKVWEHEGLILTKEQRQLFLHKVTKAGSIARRRRELRDIYPDSPAVQAKRFHLFIEKKDEYGHKGFLRGFKKRYVNDTSE